MSKLLTVGVGTQMGKDFHTEQSKDEGFQNDEVMLMIQRSIVHGKKARGSVKVFNEHLSKEGVKYINQYLKDYFELGHWGMVKKLVSSYKGS